MRTFLCLLLLPLLAACRKPAPSVSRETRQEPAAFWVWHRSSSLDDEEARKLDQAGVRRLYWQVVETTWSGGRWQSTRIAKSATQEGFTIIPVFRIKPDSSFLDNPAATFAFVDLVRRWSVTGQLSEIQIDFDCPDRLLGSYAAFLREVKSGLMVRLSVTALASWPRHSDFKTLSASVDEFAPMFYDLTADAPSAVLAKRFQPIASPSDADWIRLWKNCPIPWRAGLPNFERVSVFLPDGKLSGHLRGWTRDELFFHPLLKPEPLGHGVTLYIANDDLTLAGNPISRGSFIAHRMPDENDLADLLKTAREAGTTGALYFTLPGPGIQTTFSAANPLLPPAANLKVESTPDGRIILTNTGTADLPPRACDPTDPSQRGWTLLLSSENNAVFRSSDPGQFPLLTTPDDTPAESARWIRLHFAHLPAGKSITSGPLLDSTEIVTWSASSFSGKISVNPPTR